MTVSTTQCPDCWRAETPWRRRAANAVAEFLMPNSFSAAVASCSATFSASWGAMMGVREPTWYEKHRDKWIETGDLEELTRMVRHVSRET